LDKCNLLEAVLYLPFLDASSRDLSRSSCRPGFRPGCRIRQMCKAEILRVSHFPSRPVFRPTTVQARHDMPHHQLSLGARYLKPNGLSQSSLRNASAGSTATSPYDPQSYYPARLGEAIHGKYQLISKLGQGTGSTVWLASTVSR
jgi:hypothetical protein